MASSQPTLQQLQDDIDLYKVLLASCEDQPDDPSMEEDKRHYAEKLARLREQYDQLDYALTHANGSDSVHRPGHLLKLPSRKRDRTEFGSDLDSEGPRIKSRISTPDISQSPALSAADSIGSDYFDDPGFSDLLGQNWRDQLRQQAHEHETRRRQEEEDARIARELQEQYNTTNLQSAPQKPSSTHTQATFRSNGSFGVPQATQQSSSSQPLVKSERNQHVYQSLDSSASDSDDSLAMVDPSEFYQRFPPSAGPSRNLPATWAQTSQSMPGAFPGMQYQSAYTSRPGQSVYNNPAMPQNGILERLSALPGLQSLSALGSSSLNAIDLEGHLPFSLPDLNRILDPSWESVDPRETQEEIRQLLNNIRPDEELDAAAADDLQPPGLKVTLMPHQRKGLAWMKKMEEGSNKGGILADDMGLGKTIQALALMLASPPENAMPTLVVCPVALMEQWRREILKHVRPRYALTVKILHGAQGHLSWRQIQHFNVVLTSYGTLASELKRKVRWDEKFQRNPDAKKSRSDECPILDDKAKFHRVFLDEAQNIKNKNTQAAAAACRINSVYRWCLTGTPMQNNVDEMYSLIRFLRIRPYNDPDRFAREISRPLKSRLEHLPKQAMKKLRALLKAILLRRTKKSEIDGQPILQLPEKHTHSLRATFGSDQLQFYKALEMSAKIQFNKYLKAGTVGQNYSRALVLLLRLRQCCCSPQLVTNAKDFITETGIEGLDMVANAKDLLPEVVERIKEQGDIECPVCFDAVDCPVIFNPCGHQLCHECFSRMAGDVNNDNANNIVCPHCRARIDTKKINDLDSFKQVFMDIDGPPAAGEVAVSKDLSSETESGDSDDESDDDSDDEQSLKDFVVDDGEPVEAASNSDGYDSDGDLDRVRKPRKGIKRERKIKDEIPDFSDDGGDETQPGERVKSKMRESSKQRKVASSKKPKKATKKHKGKGKKKKDSDPKTLAELRKEGLKSKSAKKKYLRQLEEIYEPCAKIDKLLEALEEIQNRGEGEKSIVFSSFTSFLDLVEVPLFKHPTLSIYTRYDGSMTAKERNDAVLRFTDDPNCRVILVSLKAGNAGLNLTTANHVFILDPFWNPFVEYQAADRAHRIGQRREVHVHRILIGEEGVDHEQNPENEFTVEDRILRLQEKKRQLVEAALDENAASSVGRLGTRELGYLFGVNGM